MRALQLVVALVLTASAAAVVRAGILYGVDAEFANFVRADTGAQTLTIVNPLDATLWPGFRGQPGLKCLNTRIDGGRGAWYFGFPRLYPGNVSCITKAPLPTDDEVARARALNLTTLQGLTPPPTQWCDTSGDWMFALTLDPDTSVLYITTRTHVLALSPADFDSGSPARVVGPVPFAPWTLSVTMPSVWDANPPHSGGDGTGGIIWYMGVSRITCFPNNTLFGYQPVSARNSSRPYTLGLLDAGSGLWVQGGPGLNALDFNPVTRAFVALVPSEDYGATGNVVRATADVATMTLATRVQATWVGYSNPALWDLTILRNGYPNATDDGLALAMWNSDGWQWQMQSADLHQPPSQAPLKPFWDFPFGTTAGLQYFVAYNPALY